MDVTVTPPSGKHLSPDGTAQLAQLTPEIDWPKLFADTGVPGVTDLNVANPDFFKGLQAIFESTDLDTIKTYLRWQLIDSAPEYALPKAMSEEDFNFNNHELRGQPEQAPRWKRCVRATDAALGEALGQVYVEDFFPSSSKAYTLQMVHDIEGSMGNEINDQTWMSAETKAKAQGQAAHGCG